MAYQLKYKPFGEQSVLVEWPQRIDKDILHDVLSFKTKIQNFNTKNNIEVNNAYCSLLVNYNDSGLDFSNEIDILESLYKSEEDNVKQKYRLWKVPVCYDESFGIDLEELSKSKNLSINEIIKRHTSAIYSVYFIGFLPGFLYLGGLDEVLHTPRKATPRLKIAKGAVAIGGNQTGIYPNESPGGWNIIGNSPIDFFDISKEDPCFASSGDQIQFYTVSTKEYRDIKTLVEAGVYHIESEVIND